ncbi:MAG TPA: class III extradiol ring-cleavage dioxygenase [Desulfobacter postgatei]|uniref:DODA-type extradiol aromatic ring-opening family dioxygenase n=1 Tax=Desulfobacter sp. TaxID=2294 RepID=UPI000E7E97A4|nr:class III extradiol ring-cleavage dioxygenase [Desulfobacter sp.]HBT87541.1 dioxygenase [Desulfobacter sp.]HRF89619.1 class III extradiol ring-cleavage dioxygenase [Desulfobacter postgatei]
MTTPKTDSAIIYIPHGGGPLPLLGHAGHDAMNAFLKELAAMLPKPKAVVVISAHWETDPPMVTSHPAPELIYDYYGFPRQAYEIAYPAAGHPELALKAVALLTEAGIKARADATRGFDHGVYIPLTLMLPKADVPCIQISLSKGLDAERHLLMGEALRPLLTEDIWLLGSGFSFHNMREFDLAAGPASSSVPDTHNRSFQDWLKKICADEKIFPEQQKDKLLNWELAPAARHCHPREEHLMPLLVCAGAAGYRPAHKVFDVKIMGRSSVAILNKAP